MEKKSNAIWWVIGGVIVIGLIIWVATAGQSAQPSANEPVTTTDSGALQAPDASEDVTTGSVNVPVTTGVKPVTLSYAQALITYANRRIQLDATCQATPNNVTYKNNTNIMIDNRSALTRTVHLGSIYTIKPYGFKIVNLYVPKVPGTFYLDCGKGQNAATILIQK